MKKRILLVEDDPICSTIEKKLFETFGCEVVIANSGEAAVKLFAQSVISQTPFDAISMDIGLPGKNGIEVCESIRKYEAETSPYSTPIVAVTSNADPEITKKCLSAGMLDVMPKPVMKEAVIQFLKVCHLAD